MSEKMDSEVESFRPASKIEVLEYERSKLLTLFADFDQGIKDLVAGLIDDAAFLRAENWELSNLIAVTGMIKVHPQRPDLQKPVQAAAQYRANEKVYANIIGKLAMIIQRGQGGEEDDDFDEFNHQYG